MFKNIFLIEHLQATASDIQKSRSKKISKKIILNSNSHLGNFFYLLQWKPFKNDEICFYFILKSLFVLKEYKFLSWFFCPVEKATWLER